ncbi:MAG: glycosyltransferase [Candidatus Micrarchaeota archaeon]
MRIALVMVTMDVPEKLRKHLELLRGQTRKPDGIVVVNNGKSPVDFARKEFAGDFALHFLSFDNIGPAGGFKEGAKKAYAEGYDYIIFADDDAFPAGNGMMERFYAHAGKGDALVAGYYTNGSPIGLSNHYMMVRRDIFPKVGFYFDPFFLMSEDIEFAERLQGVASVVHDKGIVIDHPWRITTDSFRTYLSARNVYMHMAITGKAAVFCYYFLYNSVRGAFFALSFRKPAFLLASIQAFWDFALGRAGRRSAPADRLGLKEARLDGLDRKKSLFIATGLEKAGEELAGAGIETLREGELVGSGARGGSPLSLLRGMARLVRRLAGRDVILANQFSLAVPPYSTFAGKVFLYDELKGRIFLFYENNAFLALAFQIVAVPLAVLSLPAALAVFFLKMGHYKGLYQRKIAEDLEFCRAHSRP